jgi:hypothetical protein
MKKLIFDYIITLIETLVVGDSINIVLANKQKAYFLSLGVSTVETNQDRDCP